MGSKKTIKESAPKIPVISLEMDIHALVNRQRHAYDLHLLKYNPKLAVIAREHSNDMQMHNFFSHTNLSGEDPTQRARRKQFPCRKVRGKYIYEGIAENIFKSAIYHSISYINGHPHYHWNTPNDIVRTTVMNWMKSPGHRKNILSTRYDSEGIGVTISDDGKIFVTQNFF